MKITKRHLRRIIKEALLLEEPADYLRDYKAGSITHSEYKQLVRDFENRTTSRRERGAVSNPAKWSDSPSSPEPEAIWGGTPKELEARVHRYLIDIGFYHGSDTGRVWPMSKPTGPGAHPDGGYTSNIPRVIKAGIASGDIDWATWPEIEPTYRKIDRSID